MGKLLVGSYSLDVEDSLFDLLLFAESGMFMEASDGLGSSLTSEFEVNIPDNAKPVCH